jgi:hypothetical protein
MRPTAADHHDALINNKDAYLPPVPPSLWQPETPREQALFKHSRRIAALYGATDIGVRVMRRLDRARGRDTSLLDRAHVKPLCRERFRDADFADLARPSLARVSPLPIEQAVAALARVERGFGGLLVRQAS